MRRLLIETAKIAISAGLIWAAFSRIDAASAFALLRSIDAGVVVAAIALLAFQLFVAGVRLRHLLRLIGSPIGLLKAVDTIFVGVFFSQTLISFIGGDAMRVWRLMSSGVAVSSAFKAVLFDRVTGFFILIAMIVAGLPLLFGVMTDTAMRASVVAAVLLGVFATLVFLFMNRLPVALRRWRIFRIAAEISDVALSISGRPADISYLLGLSLVMQIVNVITLLVIAGGLGVDARFVDLLVLVPPVMLLAMLPISFAGWGVREGAMAVSLGLVGIGAEQSVAMSICFGLSATAVGLPGGLIWLAARRKETVKPR